MNTNIKGTNIELTPAIKEYVLKRVQSFEKFIPSGDESAKCEVDVGKTTHHHKQGDFFRAEINLHVAGKNLYAVSEKDDLYVAIDKVRDEIAQALTSHKDKKMTLFRKGALRVKNMLKGLPWRSE